jgi:hypothetical protein
MSAATRPAFSSSSLSIPAAQAAGSRGDGACSAGKKSGRKGALNGDEPEAAMAPKVSPW